MRGHCVVIPQSLRERILKQLHENHSGVVRMKGVPRSYFWWPGLDKEIKEVSRQCHSWRTNADNPPRARLHLWKWSKGPNQHIHTNFLEIEKQFFIVLIDAYSEWIQIQPMRDITAETTVEVFQDCIANCGIPINIVSYNVVRRSRYTNFVNFSTVWESIT